MVVRKEKKRQGPCFATSLVPHHPDLFRETTTMSVVVSQSTKRGEIVSKNPFNIYSVSIPASMRDLGAVPPIQISILLGLQDPFCSSCEPVNRVFTVRADFHPAAGGQVTRARRLLSGGVRRCVQPLSHFVVRRPVQRDNWTRQPGIRDNT